MDHSLTPFIMIFFFCLLEGIRRLHKFLSPYLQAYIIASSVNNINKPNKYLHDPNEEISKEWLDAEDRRIEKFLSNVTITFPDKEGKEPPKS